MPQPEYTADGDRVRWKRTALKGADASTFEVLGESFARDAKHAYFQSRRASARRRAPAERSDANRPRLRGPF